MRRGDVLSAWAGIRPLVRDPAAGDTASLVRNHVVHIRFGLSSFCLVLCPAFGSCAGNKKFGDVNLYPLF